MFESASLSHRIEKAFYRREEPKLRDALLNGPLLVLAQPFVGCLDAIAPHGGVLLLGRGRLRRDARHVAVRTMFSWWSPIVSWWMVVA